MELYLAERLRKYRKEKELTQEALAQVIGVSPQSISKWECGDGYPDITLLPGIANYFGVTIDELLGNDEISAREDVQQNYFNVHGKLSPEENLELALKYYRKYPRNWHIATSLMHEITKNHRDKLDEYRPLLNEITERILNACTDTAMRRSAVKAMCMVCKEEELETWMKKDTRFWYMERLDIYEERFRLMEDSEQAWMYWYAGNFLRAANTIFRLCRHEKSYWGDAEGYVEWLEKYLCMLDGMTGRKTDEDIPDGWIPEYVHVFHNLANGLCGLGDFESGYTYLERSAVLEERCVKIPVGTPMDLGNPLVFGETKILKEKWGIELPNGKHFPQIQGIRIHLNDLLYCVTTDNPVWSWFNPLRNEERFGQILARAKALSEMTE